MEAGAKGVEIRISGKVTSQRARTQIFRAGTMSKSGQPAQEGIDKGVAQCVQKSGVLGIIVKIMKADTKMGDEIKIKEDLLAEAQARAKARKKKAELKVEEKEDELSPEDQELLDEVDEKAISEISLESKEEEKKKK